MKNVKKRIFYKKIKKVKNGFYIYGVKDVCAAYR